MVMDRLQMRESCMTEDGWKQLHTRLNGRPAGEAGNNWDWQQHWACQERLYRRHSSPDPRGCVWCGWFSGVDAPCISCSRFVSALPVDEMIGNRAAGFWMHGMLGDGFGNAWRNDHLITRLAKRPDYYLWTGRRREGYLVLLDWLWSLGEQW